MNYKDMLNKLINESGLTNKEILLRCEELGEKITPNYLSVLKNQENKIASDELSIVLAKACNAQFENILMLQGYIDKSPEVMVKALEKVKIATIDGMKLAYQQIPEKQKGAELAQYINYVENMPLAELFCFLEKSDLANIDELELKIKTTPKKWALIEIYDEKDIKVLDEADLAKILR